MDFRTTVDIKTPGLSVAPDARILLLGSCFAVHVGRRMAESGLDAHVNPFGVLYNPLSISAMCDAMVAGEDFPDDCFLASDGGWYSWLNDSSFFAQSREECSARLRQVLRKERERLPLLDYLFLTFGTNRCYVLNHTGRIVGNCHKQPARCFSERLMEVDEVCAALERTLERLWSLNPGLKVVFTVSPYRYAKYGLHDSQLGKAVLLLAVDRLCRRFADRCCYFPAYEIVLDELRDYRFYAEDMLHPSQQAVDYVWERFASCCLAPQTQAFVAEWKGVSRALSHRPFHPESAAYGDFLRQTMLKMERLIEKYPNLAERPEYEKLKELLKS